MSDLQKKEISETMRFHETVSKNALSAWGIYDVSYVKQTKVNDKNVWVICSAEGNIISVAPNRETALAMVKQNDMEPMNAH